MKTKAFSLIEMLVVVGILAVVAVIALPSLFGGSHEADLNSATEQIVASARTAQNQAANQTKDAQWGIYFSNATSAAPFYAVFSGSSYASGTVQSVYRLPATIGFVSSTLPVGSSTTIIFSDISGAASASTTVKLYVISQPAISSSISIAQTGVVAYVTPTMPGSSSSGNSGGQNIYVVDAGNSRVEVFNTSGAYLSQFGSYGTSTGELIFGSSGNAHSLDGVAVNASGDIFVPSYTSNYSNIQEFSSNGAYLSTIGSYGNSNGQFEAPNGLVFDSAGNLYVADNNNARIEILSATDTYESQLGSYGSGNYQFEGIPDIAVDAKGDSYAISNIASQIKEFSATGTYILQFGSQGSGSGQFNYPVALAIDGGGNIWVSDFFNNRVEEFSAIGTYENQIGSYGSGNGYLSAPQGVAIDSSGNIWVVDGGNSRVEEFSPTGTYESQFGSWGNGNGQFEYPGGITIH